MQFPRTRIWSRNMRADFVVTELSEDFVLVKTYDLVNIY